MAKIGNRSGQSTWRLAYAAVMAAGCFIAGCSTTPRIMPTDLKILGKSELGFLAVGESTREQVLLRMGNPSSRFEEDRILIYQVRFRSDGKVDIYSPKSIGSSGFREWEPATSSLVLVFNPDNLLFKIGLVDSK